MINANSNIFKTMSSAQLIKILEQNREKKAMTDGYWRLWLTLFNRDFPKLECPEPVASENVNDAQAINTLKATHYEHCYNEAEIQTYLEEMDVLICLDKERRPDAKMTTGNRLADSFASTSLLTSLRDIVPRAARVMGQSTDSNSALSIAICTGNTRGVEILIKYGADTTQPDEINLPPIFYALEFNNINIDILMILMNEMVKRNAIDRKYQNTTVLDAIVQHGDPDLTNLIISSFPNIYANTSNDPLWVSVRDNNAIMVSYLLFEHQLDANMLVSNISPILFKYISLHTIHCSRGGYIGRENYDPNDMTILGALIDAGAQVNILVRSYKMTPLMYAASQNLEHIVEFLLKNGANPSMTNEAGKTANDMTNNTAIKAMLAGQFEQQPKQNKSIQ